MESWRMLKIKRRKTQEVVGSGLYIPICTAENVPYCSIDSIVL
jgi:hypothetical protein